MDHPDRDVQTIDAISALLSTEVAHEVVGGMLLLRAVVLFFLCLFLMRAERIQRKTWWPFWPWPPTMGWKLTLMLASDTILYLVLGFGTLTSQDEIPLWGALLVFAVFASGLALFAEFAKAPKGEGTT